VKIDFKILDGIRGIAAFYVVVNHCRGNMLIGGSELAKISPINEWSLWTKLYYSLLQFTSLGREFVVVFFVLSGFSIAHSLQKNNHILTFYKKRLIRLYPPYLLALFYAYFVFNITHKKLLIAGESVFENINNVINNLFYIPSGQMIPQFWSLTHEVIFYLIAPLIIYSVNKKKLYYYLSILVYFYSVFKAPFSFTGQNIIEKFIFDYNIFFAIGIYLYNTIENYINFKIFNKKYYLFLLSFLIITLMVVIKFKFGEYNKFTSIIAAIYSIILIIFFLKYKIQNKLFQYLGEISYTLYITHFASIYLITYFLIKTHLIDKQFTESPFIWLIGVFGCVLLAIPLYLIGEKPSKILLSKIRKN
jgi:peptidoglycan/LPS O-acetylase OafA/YrhL